MQQKNRIFIEIIFGLGLITAAVYFFIGSEEKSIRPAGLVDIDSGTRVVMGTFARVVAVAEDSNTAKSCIEAAFTEIENIDNLMSKYKDDSEISELNRNGFRQAVKVSKSTYEVFQKAVEFSRISDGAFDITIGPLVDLWHSAAEADSVPTDTELAEVRSKVGFDKLILDANETSVRFAVNGMRVDLGGIAKGYAIDNAVEVMKKNGAAGGMVDIGGDIRCFGLPPEGQNNWRIGLQDPKKAKESFDAGIPLLVLNLTNVAVTTSGHYRQFVTIGGQRYSHIINPESGLGSENLTSITIICPSATDADALSTAVAVMGKEKGLTLIEQMPDVEAILITQAPEFKRLQTAGAEKYIE